MQTFLAYPNFTHSALILDNKRLNKQITEGRQILDILVHHPDSRWRNHPAVLMWKGHEYSLVKYVCECYNEWYRRLEKELRKGSYNHKSYGWIGEHWDDIRKCTKSWDPPKWFGDEKFHASHRSNLLRKNYEYYSQFGWKEPIDFPYFWPTKQGY